MNLYYKTLVYILYERKKDRVLLIGIEFNLNNNF